MNFMTLYVSLKMNHSLTTQPAWVSTQKFLYPQKKKLNFQKVY